MEQAQKCPIDGMERPQYKYCSEAHTPFSAENMRALQVQLASSKDKEIPDQLRRLYIQDFRKKETQPIHRGFFINWLYSGYKFATNLYDKFRAEYFASSPEAAVPDADLLWHLITGPHPDGQGPIFVTVRNILDFAFIK